MKMIVDTQLVKRLENLSKIELSQKERALMETDLEKILSFMDKLDSLDTDSAEPARRSPVKLEDLRDDIAESPALREDILSNAPRQSEGCFAVPKTVDGGEV